MPKPPPRLTFEHVYSTHLGYVRRRVRRLGVAEEAVDDVAQQVFLVIYRRLADLSDFRHASAWISAIVVRAVRFHQRTARRKSPHLFHPPHDPETLADSRSPEPHDTLSKVEAARLVQRWINELDHKKRQVFILSQIEEIPAAEIAKMTSLNVNTVQSRVRSARHDLARVAECHRRRDTSRLR